MIFSQYLMLIHRAARSVLTVCRVLTLTSMDFMFNGSQPPVKPLMGQFSVLKLSSTQRFVCMRISDLNSPSKFFDFDQRHRDYFIYGPNQLLSVAMRQSALRCFLCPQLIFSDPLPKSDCVYSCFYQDHKVVMCIHMTLCSWYSKAFVANNVLTFDRTSSPP